MESMLGFTLMAMRVNVSHGQGISPAQCFQAEFGTGVFLPSKCCFFCLIRSVDSLQA